MRHPKTSIFQFKQFSVDQTDCAMKVNTDGVLLGALATADHPQSILDIGTGTGVIALMLAQRYAAAIIDAVEIDPPAALTAGNNFLNSPFQSRCSIHPVSFEKYFIENPGKKYDLIVSNPPFFINSLKSTEKSKEIARHTTLNFFSDLFSAVKEALTKNGRLSMILPVETADTVKDLAAENGLHLQEQVLVHSFPHSLPHRHVISFGTEKCDLHSGEIIIYKVPGSYTEQYALLLRDFLTIF